MSNHGESRPDYETEFMAADRRFAAEVDTAAADDRARIWATWFAPDGRQIVPGRVVQGQSSIAEMMAGAFGTPGYSLAWEPDRAVVSTAGDLGWTSGRYQSTSPGPQEPATSAGRYLTIWRRQADGTLKVDLDTGVPDGE
jgi:uncharacterized protein (TIGR02246 family)